MDTLLKFTIENYRSIADRKSMDFTPKSIKDEPQTNVVEYVDVKYLRTVAIYGANSSGKSNFIQAIALMSLLVQTSVKMNDDEDLVHNPFVLNSEYENRPTLFEAEFITNNIRYRYGFSNTKKRICDEWLIRKEKSGAETNLFIRTLDGIGVDERYFKEGKDLEEKTNDNRLFLSLVAQIGGDISKSIIKFFTVGINVISGLNTFPYAKYSKVYLNQKQPGSDSMIDLFGRVQLGFNNVVSNIIKDKTGKDDYQVLTSHNIYDNEGTAIGTREFDLELMESAGTQKLFDISGPIFETLNWGSVLVIDELDAKMHPLISQELVSLFNDPLRNKNGAQLIFSTHDTNLLSCRILRRDQIWFTEKDSQERTDIYNMMQIVLPDGAKPRGDGNIERNYIRGRYGAIPYIRPYSE